MSRDDNTRKWDKTEWDDPDWKKPDWQEPDWTKTDWGTPDVPNGNAKPVTKEKQLENLKENIKYGDWYISENKDKMNPEDLRMLEQKQRDREIQIENLEKDIAKDAGK